MSADIVDDLHNAEDRIGQLDAALGRVLAGIDTFIAIWKDDPRRVADNPLQFRDRLREVMAEGQRVRVDRYCRASCHGTFVRPPDFTDERGMVWEGECCDDECGCPCGHEGS